MGLESSNGILEDISAEIGYTATSAIICWFGGTTLYIPQNIEGKHVLKSIIGESAFKHFVKNYGGEILSIPIEDDRLNRMRRMRRMAGMLANGLSIKQIARMEAMTVRQVHNIRSQLEQEGIISYVRHSGKTHSAHADQLSLDLSLDLSVRA